ncbi:MULTISPECIES: hypothetical protein [unclassified Microcystis]|jgi:hypothetical protein|uniref:hypothetical protein n=1 Tax=unclassified Microcystis TaxID=2643300 RepID=UPI0022BA9B67|nr:MULTISPECIES: hypothetical protein [unclassified Microcystis]MCA2691932.1 hypothetical protein [Microcystis sp. M034S2]MCZ8202221.1 hypothetical protein [Microcystis sp. LE19-55.1A]
MLIYASLTDYLQDNHCLDELPQLCGSDRPFLVLEDDEELTKQYPFLMQRQPSRLFWFLCGNEVYTDSFFDKIVLKVLPDKHFTIP